MRASLIELDVKQNGPRAAIEREIVKQVAKIDVQLIPDRYDSRKPHRSWCGPFYKTRGNRPGLRNQGQVSRTRRAGGKTGIELPSRHEHAETVGSDNSHAVCTRRTLGCLGKRTRPVTQTRREDDRRRAALRAQSGNQPGHDGGRRGDDREIRCIGEIIYRFDRGDAFDVSCGAD